MAASTLTSTVAALLGPGRGILAADESFPTIGKRFQALGIPSTEANRLAWRELLCTTPGLGEWISGVILFDETIRQKPGAVSIPEILVRQAILPGIKVDMGTIPLPGFAGEKITQGLDGLRERLAGYRELGARFTKWRAVFAPDEGRPTQAGLDANVRALALFAALSQEAGLVPIVEPEVLMDGNHTLARCVEVTTAVLQAVFAALFEHRVGLEEMLLKTGLVLPGRECPQQVEAEEVAGVTLRCLRRVVPAAVPGIVFLSGGQSDVVATARLNAICGAGGAPWQLSFSFGRALQDAALATWRGSPAHRAAAQAALAHRAHCNSLAVQGRYSARAEAAPPPGRTVSTRQQQEDGEAVAAWENEGDPN
ncbi:MAG: class I fructose-bisphosphate aldolase [Opitutales bacterium]